MPLTKKQMKIARVAEPRDKITGEDFKELRKASGGIVKFTNGGEVEGVEPRLIELNELEEFGSEDARELAESDKFKEYGDVKTFTEGGRTISDADEERIREMTRRQLKRSDERRKQKQKSTKEATDGMASMLGSLLSESGKGMSDADRRRVEKMLSDDKPKTDRQEMQFKRGGGVKTTSISRGCGAVVRGKKFAGTF